MFFAESVSNGPTVPASRRRSVAAVLAAVAVVSAATPAAAEPGGVVLQCSLHYNSFSYPTYTAGDCVVTRSGWLAYTGYARLDAVVDGGSIASFANGQVYGDVNLEFLWQRVGAAGVISTTGDVAGAGAVVFSTPTWDRWTDDSVTIALAGT